MSNVPYILTTNGLTFYVGSQPFAVDKTAVQFAELVAELAKPAPDQDKLIELASAASTIQAALDEIAEGGEEAVQYLTKGHIKVDRRGVTFNGQPVKSALADRMMEILGLGLPLGPWIKFAENLFQNPADWSRDELFLWLEKSDLPITEDGYFLAYKIVRDNYTDVHSGTFDNSVGQIVELPNREAVDPNRNNTCSKGLHFCSKGYLPHFGGASYGGGHVMIVKINPADVVSIPADYDNAKGRTWRYEVVDEINYEEALGIKWAPIVGYGTPVEEPEEVDEDVEFEDDTDDRDADWQVAYDDTADELESDGIVSLRNQASRYPAAKGRSGWIWKQADRADLIDFIATQEADAAVA